MNCTNCHFELSECLDGRLPSGRRAAVMAHVESCAECAAFWSELQRAQQLVLQLPRERVGCDFREQLFARIAAGEGTPPAVFREPVPLATKARYLLTGATAAAAVLFAASLLRDRSGDGDDVLHSGRTLVSASPATENGSGRRAPGGDAPGDRMSGAQGSAGSATLAAVGTGDQKQLQRRTAPAPQVGGLDAGMISAFRPLTSDLLAGEAAKQFERQYEWTAKHLDRLQVARATPAAAAAPAPAPMVESTVREICDNAIELKKLGDLLLDMRRDRRVSFEDENTEVELRILVRLLDVPRLREQRSLETVELVVAPALRDSSRLGELTRELRVRPAIDNGDMQPLLRLMHGRQELLHRLFVPLPEEELPFPQPNSVLFLFQDDCGVRLVAPRSQFEVMLRRGR